LGSEGRRENAMKRPGFRRRIAAALLVGGTLAATASAAEVVIITHPATGTSNLTKAEIQDIFTGRKTRWASGATMVPVLVEVDGTHEAFLSTYVQKTPAQFDTWWKRQIFTGKASPPRSFKTEREVVDFVSRTEGSLGYVSKSAVADGVKIVAVQ
jgi:ABC-type phosphate transport system substrate-binding protein